jgi:hypothetical protein
MCNFRPIILSIEAMKELLHLLFPSQFLVASSGAKSQTMNVLATKTKSGT